MGQHDPSRFHAGGLTRLKQEAIAHCRHLHIAAAAAMLSACKAGWTAPLSWTEGGVDTAGSDSEIL